MDMDENHFVIRQPRVFLWIGVICVLFFCALIVLMVVFSNETTVWWVYLGFSFFVALGLFLMIYCITWELRIDDNQIEYCSFVGMKKVFTFQNVTRVELKSMQNGMQQIKAYDGKEKLFATDSNCRGYNVLISRLKKEQIPFC